MTTTMKTKEMAAVAAAWGQRGVGGGDCAALAAVAAQQQQRQHGVGSGSLVAAAWQWWQRNSGRGSGSSSLVAAVAAWWQRGINGGSSTAGKAVATWWRLRQLCFSAAVAAQRRGWQCSSNAAMVVGGGCGEMTFTRARRSRCYVMRNFGNSFTGTYVFLLVPHKSAYCTILLGIKIPVLEIQSHC